MLVTYHLWKKTRKLIFTSTIDIRFLISSRHVRSNSAEVHHNHARSWQRLTWLATCRMWQIGQHFDGTAAAEALVDRNTPSLELACFTRNPPWTHILWTKAGRQSTLRYTHGSSLSVDGAQTTNSMMTQDTDKLFIQVRPPCGCNTYVLRLIVLICVERIMCPRVSLAPPYIVRRVGLQI